MHSHVAIVIIIVLVSAGTLALFVRNYFKRRHEVLPRPDKSAERMYDIQYFYRANGRTDK